jgi:hypothetical protein
MQKAKPNGCAIAAFMVVMFWLVAIIVYLVIG